MVNDPRVTRRRRLKLAWAASVLSKTAVAAVQIIAVPVVYKVLGAAGYAAYASVTATASVMNILNLGVGGAIVTPVAAAASRNDKQGEAILVKAGLAPMLVILVVGMIIAVPVVSLAPLATLVGKVARYDTADLRAALIISVAATTAMLPLSGLEILRQAYQESYITALFTTTANLALCGALITASVYAHSLWVFVLLFVGVPLCARLANALLLVVTRPYLFATRVPFDRSLTVSLLKDGIRYVGSNMANILVYQWPVYWLARIASAEESSRFAICVQLVLLPISSTLTVIQPLWGSVADSIARNDRLWIWRQLRRARVLTIYFGLGIICLYTGFGDLIVKTWLRRELAMAMSVKLAMGLCIAATVWEYLHFTFCLGVGELRRAAVIVLQRSLIYALAVPGLWAMGHETALWAGAFVSVVGWSAWRLCRILAERLGEKEEVLVTNV